MSATTMAVATSTETLEPPPRSGKAALPVPDAAMSVHAWGAAPSDFLIVQAGPRQFKQC
jgi:hypothetical protein